MSTAETVTRGSRPSDPRRRRVVLVAESAGLAAVLTHLLDPGDLLSCLSSPRELDESRSLDAADVVVLDLPAAERAAAVGRVRRRYLGPLVIVVAKGETARGLKLDDACALLSRPFSTGGLAAALAVPGRPVTAPRADSGPQVPPFIPAGAGQIGVALAVPPGADAPEAPVPSAADLKATARRAWVRPAPPATPSRLSVIDRVQRLLVSLTEGWQARRRVRVAGFSAFALIAFTVAFALAAQGGRCGPGCDAFGTVFAPEPTVAPASSRAPSTTGPKRSTTTTAPSGSPGTGAFRSISGGGLATTTTTAERRVTTTMHKPSSGGGGPASTTPTRPPTTTPTTQPATTATPTTQPATTATPTTQPATTATPTTGGA